MKKIQKQLLPYKFVIIILLVMIIGVGITVKASTLSNNVLDMVIERIADRFIQDMESESNSVGVNLGSTVTTKADLTAKSVTTTSGLTVNGVASIASSFDGFFAYGEATVSTTTNDGITAIYTNNSGTDMICNGNTGSWYSNQTGFAPVRQISLGEMSTATAYSDGSLIASTTVATSTDTMTVFTATIPFLLENGNSIVASVGDGTAGDLNNQASSTSLSNWEMQVAVDCRIIGQ